MHDTGRRQLTRTVDFEERILQSFEDNPNARTRDIAQQFGVCQSAEWRIVPELSRCLSLTTLTGRPEIPNLSRDSFTNIVGLYVLAHIRKICGFKMTGLQLIAQLLCACV
ncbi:hypothetical protein TNCT_385241 [Trichonephila clavata]|uniref:Uncharacterized protein n=1 Tax=Trichonephila clavata TaxID=2740835 RepID=A0A8X6IUN6_TRICU|nr:hypothetical protein TNCT_385241 [Trichonephila clavata]